MTDVARTDPASIGARTRLGVVLGAPIEHSASPALHNAAFAAIGMDAVFLAMRVAPGSIGEAVAGLRALQVLGASVTVPYKEVVREYCDQLEPLAERVGAVNCLQFEDGKIIGHNTDAGGFVDGLVHGLGVEPAGANVVLLGAGGAARAVSAGLITAGAQIKAVVARTPSRVQWTACVPWTVASLAEQLVGCELLVDCTSMGLSDASEANVPAPVPLDVLGHDAVVATLVYHREPALLAAARAHGLRTLDGAAMLVSQGARAFELWTGTSAPLPAMRAALQVQLEARRLG